MRFTMTNLFTLAVCTISLSLLFSCGQGSGGVEGNLIFYDLTREPGDPFNLNQQLNQPIALGADIEIAVRDNSGVEVAVESASSDDETVFTVSNHLRNVTQLHAVAAGNANLSVTAGGATDRILLQVSEIGSSEVQVLPWGESTLLPTSVYENGVALTPGTNTSLFLHNLDSAGNELTGYGALALSVVPASATLTPTDGTDFYTLRAMNELGTITLSTEGVEESIEVVDIGAITSITLNNVNQNGAEVASEFIIQQGAHLFTISAYTEDGRYVIAPLDDTFEVEILEASEPYISYSESSAEGQDILDDGRALFLDFLQAGTAEFTIRWLTFELPFSVSITPRQDQNPDGDGGADGE